MDNKLKIHVVDDEPLNIEVMREMFHDIFDLECFSSGGELLETLENSTPDLILLDVAMPEMDGYEVCRRIRDDFTFSAIPIIFVSARDRVEDRIAGYEAGGDDFVTKPFISEELLAKVKVNCRHKELTEGLAQQANFATQTAMTAMTASGELGVCIEFLDKSTSCRTYEELAKQFFIAAESFGLNTTIQFRPSKEEFFDFAQVEPVKPLESELLSRSQNKDRIIDFGQRTIINFADVSCLFKNMPLDEPEKYGRYKDNLAILLNGASARVKSLKLELDVRRQKTALSKVMMAAHRTLMDIDRAYQEHTSASDRLLTRLVQEMDAQMLSLQLDPAQEKLVLDMIQHAKNQINELHQTGLQIDERFEKMMSMLQQVVSD